MLNFIASFSKTLCANISKLIKWEKTVNKKKKNNRYSISILIHSSGLANKILATNIYRTKTNITFHNANGLM